MKIREQLINLIYSIATGARWRRLLIAPVGFIIFIAIATGFIFLAFYLDSVFRLPKLPHLYLTDIISIFVICIGVFLTLWSVVCFIRVRGTPVPFSPPPKLVVNGPYKYARNPMLTGLFLQLFGIGFLFRSFALTIIFTPLLILLNVIELKLIEEPELEKRLGTAYVDYKKRVPMFIPRFPKQ